MSNIYKCISNIYKNKEPRRAIQDAESPGLEPCVSDKNFSITVYRTPIDSQPQCLGTHGNENHPTFKDLPVNQVEEQIRKELTCFNEVYCHVREPHLAKNQGMPPVNHQWRTESCQHDVSQPGSNSFPRRVCDHRSPTPYPDCSLWSRAPR